MATIHEVNAVIGRLSDGLRDEVAQTMADNSDSVADMIREQIYSGLDGNGKNLSPSYLEDPYFNENGPWKGRARDYMMWKKIITPPEQSTILMLPARPESIPNLFITGTFHTSIKTRRNEDGLTVYTDFRDGASIERKYGEQIFGMTDTAKSYFIERYLSPRLEDFYRRLGIRL